MRTLILVTVLVLFAAACSNPSKADPSPSEPRNLVCERVAELKKLKKVPADATCTAEHTDVGEGHVNTARVGFDVEVDGKTAHVVQACGLAAGQLSMPCAGLVAEAKAEPQPAPATAPTPPAAAPEPPKPAPAKGGKK